MPMPKTPRQFMDGKDKQKSILLIQGYYRCVPKTKANKKGGKEYEDEKGTKKKENQKGKTATHRPIRCSDNCLGGRV
jgi:hypothetical protein